MYVNTTLPITELEKAKNDCIRLLADMGYNTERVGCVEPVGPVSNPIGFITLGNSYVISRNPSYPSSFVLIKLVRAVVGSSYKNKENLRQKLISSVFDGTQIGSASVAVEPCVIAFLNDVYLASNITSTNVLDRSGYELRLDTLLANFAPKVAKKSGPSSSDAKFISAMIKSEFLSRRDVVKRMLDTTKVSIQQLLGVGDHRRVRVAADVEFSSDSAISIQV